MKLTSYLAVTALAVASLFGSSARAQTEHQKLYVDDGNGNFSLITGGASGLTFMLPATGGTILTNAGVGSLNLGGNFTTSGAYGLTFTLSGTTSLTLPQGPGTLMINPMGALGDMIYGGASGVATVLSGNTTTTKNFLTQTGDGAGHSAEPVWGTIANTDVSGLGTASTEDVSYFDISGAATTAVDAAVSGTSGYLALFNGTNTVISGPAYSSGTLTLGVAGSSGSAGALTIANGTLSNSGTTTFETDPAATTSPVYILPTAGPTSGTNFLSTASTSSPYTLAWSTSGGGFTNPMTTIGDIIYASATGTPATPAALAVNGAPDGEVLTLSSGLPSWQPLPSGGAVSSVSNSDGTLTISPSTGAVVASLALGHANTWTGAQAIEPSTAGAVALTLQGAATSGDVLDVESNTGASTWLSVNYAGLTTLTGGLDVSAGSVTLPNLSVANAALATDYITIQGSNVALGSSALATTSTPTFGGLTLGSPLTVANGGTGLGTLTAHGVLIGEGTANVAPTAAGTANQVLISGGASADPSWSTLTQGAGITITPGSGTITIATTALTNPMSALGDMIYGAASGVATRLVGNTTTTKNFLTQTGAGSSVSAAPVWGTIASTDVSGLGTMATQSASAVAITGGTGAFASTTAATALSASNSGAQTTAVTATSISNTATSSTASIAKVGLAITSTGTWSGATAPNTGLIFSVTGGTSPLDIDGTGGWLVTNTGLGTFAGLTVNGTETHGANSVTGSNFTISGGAITSTPISGSSGSFTTLASSGASTIATGGTSLVNSFGTGTTPANTIGATGGTNQFNGTSTFGGTTHFGTQTVDGSAIAFTGGTLSGITITNSSIGSSNPSTGAFTTITGSTSTAATDLSVTNSNATASITHTGGSITVSGAGATTTNVGLAFAVSGGTTANYDINGSGTAPGLWNVTSAGLGTFAGITDAGTTKINASANNTTEINDGTSTGQVTIGGTGAQTILIGDGNSTGADVIDIGTSLTSGAGSKTVAIATGASTTGVNTVNIATGATTVAGGNVVHIADGTPTGSGTNLVTIGSTVGASTTTINAGTGAINLSGAVQLSTESDAEATNAVTISGKNSIATVTGTATGAIAATVTNAASGQLLYLQNSATYPVILNGNSVSTGSIAEFVFLTTWQPLGGTGVDQSFSSNGTFTIVVPSGVAQIIVDAAGAGGGGGGGAPTNGSTTHSGGGGGGGGAGDYLGATAITVVAGETLTIVVGKGGTAGNAGNGGAGGSGSVGGNTTITGSASGLIVSETGGNFGLGGAEYTGFGTGGGGTKGAAATASATPSSNQSAGVAGVSNGTSDPDNSTNAGGGTGGTDGGSASSIKGGNGGAGLHGTGAASAGSVGTDGYVHIVF